MMPDGRLEDRIRAAESEVEGEKHVTRHVLDQVRRVTAEIAAVRVELTTLALRFNNLEGTVAPAMSALTAHGVHLNLLLQDVALIRQEMATRQDLALVREEMRQDIAAVREEMATRQDIAAVREEMTTRQDIAAVREEM